MRSTYCLPLNRSGARSVAFQLREGRNPGVQWLVDAKKKLAYECPSKIRSIKWGNYWFRILFMPPDAGDAVG